ncbi:UdgX family uracil-DNA binding protein [Actinophytocola xanthii]|uniref:Type-4 uracil-DNA glycosylase n=1 Tax=Actinophytocola xanthii TaxID=1912961 RepID=A0A1Q8CUD6_9PSEU|nr:UdgX family uracil-DNA binding protein [Actinophytocola xanthii]OLF17970.1 uracil-DNA glycosylase [Actinophytocola xanthii]
MTAQEFVPPDADLEQLRAAAAGCRGCDLYRDATQTVFGAGPGEARVLVVGEQPGDQEDRRGEPFVGPAGRLLDKAMVEAGIDRDLVYVTNAVKHFKFTLPERGKRRIHKTPSRTEVVACRPWLDAELDAVGPELVLCLGATAAKSLLGQGFRVTQERGRLLALPDRDGVRVMATVHPSSVLRARNREEAYRGLVTDLTAAAHALRETAAR